MEEVMMKSVLLVGVGSFVGGALRYLVSVVLRSHCCGSFPWATLAVNLLGCFIIGVLYALFSRFGATSHSACLLLTTGLCGGFTTFSTFANESLQMIQNGNIVGFLCYTCISVAAGISLVALGCCLIK
jgi:CrcB protein